MPALTINTALANSPSENDFKLPIPASSPTSSTSDAAAPSSDHPLVVLSSPKTDDTEEAPVPSPAPAAAQPQSGQWPLLAFQQFVEHLQQQGKREDVPVLKQRYKMYCRDYELVRPILDTIFLFSSGSQEMCHQMAHAMLVSLGHALRTGIPDPPAKTSADATTAPAVPASDPTPAASCSPTQSRTSTFKNGRPKKLATRPKPKTPNSSAPTPLTNAPAVKATRDPEPRYTTHLPHLRISCSNRASLWDPVIVECLAVAARKAGERVVRRTRGMGKEEVERERGVLLCLGNDRLGERRGKGRVAAGEDGEMGEGGGGDVCGVSVEEMVGETAAALKWMYA